MCSGESDVAKGDGCGGGAKEVATPCSISLEMVMNGGGRTTVKLHCAHEFHLGIFFVTCILSGPFLAKLPQAMDSSSARRSNAKLARTKSAARKGVRVVRT